MSWFEYNTSHGLKFYSPAGGAILGGALELYGDMACLAEVCPLEESL